MAKNKKNILAITECAEEASKFIGALAHQYRLLILCDLMDGEKCVSELLEELPLSQPLLSQHLKILKDREVLKTRREAQRIYYSIGDKSVLSILKILSEKYLQ